MPKVTANKITMNYDQQGTGEPLVLIPYLAADHACYAFQVPEYARHFTCISVDLRGTGESDKPQGAYTTELLADDVAAFMQAMGITKAHVAGLSLGGGVGIWLAVKHPDKVASLSVHSGWTRTDRFLQTVVESWQIVARAVGVPEMVSRAIFPWCFTPELYAERPDYIDSLAAFVRSRPPQSVPDLLQQSDAVLAHDVEAHLGRILAPTHITVGTRDQLDIHPFRRSTEARHPEFRAARVRRVCARGAVRARRGIQSADTGIPATSRGSGGRLENNGRLLREIGKHCLLHRGKSRLAGDEALVAGNQARERLVPRSSCVWRAPCDPFYRRGGDHRRRQEPRQSRARARRDPPIPCESGALASARSAGMG